MKALLLRIANSTSLADLGTDSSFAAIETRERAIGCKWYLETLVIGMQIGPLLGIASVGRAKDALRGK